MNASVSYRGNTLEIIDFSYSVKDAEMGNPYNCSFNLYVKSGVFSGLAPCEYDIKEFRRFISELKELYEFKRSSTSLNEIGYGSKITFSIDKYGCVVIEGIIYGEAMEHSLKFSSFVIDQTFLPSFINQLLLLVK